MAATALTKRVELLEETVTGPGGLTGQMTELRTEVRQLHVEMAAFRGEFLQSRSEIRIEFSAVRTEMADLADQLRAEMHALHDQLRAEMRMLNEDTRVQMRVLHEEVISRIALLHEGLNGRRRSPRPRKKR